MSAGDEVREIAELIRVAVEQVSSAPAFKKPAMIELMIDDLMTWLDLITVLSVNLENDLVLLQQRIEEIENG